MVKLFALSAALLATSATFAAPAVTPAQAKALAERNSTPFPYAQKFQPKEGLANPDSKFAKAKVAANPNITTMPSGDELSYMQSPTGETWFYNMQEVYTEVDHEAWTERVLTGFDLTVYDANLREIGKVHDDIELEGEQTSIRAIMVDASLTQKFFNSDSKYEVVVAVAAANPNYQVDYYSLVYSIGAAADENGNTPRIGRFDGYICASVNAPMDALSEDFYLSFIQEGFDPDKYDDTDASLGDEFTQYAASMYVEVTTYKKGGWSGAPQPVGTNRIYMPNLPGDHQNAPFFMATVKNGAPTFVVSYYENWYFDNAVGPTWDESLSGTTGMPNKDNNLVVDVFTIAPGSSQMTLKQSTKIFADQEDENEDVLMRYYSIGSLAFDDDLLADGTLLITLQKYLRSDDDNTLDSYYHYSADGELIDIIAEDVSGMYLMSDLAGYEPQVLLISLDETVVNPDGSVGASTGTYTFVDIYSGTTAFETASVVGSFQLKSNVDRYPVGNSYEYAFETMQAYYDEDRNVIEQIVWLNLDGEISHIDKLNIGKDVAIAQPYIASEALSPYLFDTNEAREYMWLVKRYVGNASQTAEELIIVNTEGETILTIGQDAEKGALSNIGLINIDTNPKLSILYRDVNWVQTNDFYDLPLTKFGQGGDGTAENPYKIASYGDFAEIAKNTMAHYELVADLDASGHKLPAITGQFTGSLNGNGHTISGLTTANGSIFSSLGNGAVVSDIKFVGATMENPSSTTGFIANMATGAKVTDIHVYGLAIDNADADCTFGGLVGLAALNTFIYNSSISSANINLPKAYGLGGIAGQLRTGATVSACSFSGAINAESEVGGIVGQQDADGSIFNCHVDADITAMNTIGGIVGNSAGAVIEKCYVEGSIKANGNTSSYNDNGPCAGGLVGSLNARFSTGADGSQTVNSEKIIKNNFVNLSSLEGYTPTTPERWPNQQNTLHRLVGRSFAQYEPEPTGYDEWDEPSYEGSVARPAEGGLDNNYASENMEVCDASIEATIDSTEGATIEGEKLGREWFATTLGFEYGADKAWNELSDADPALNHEITNFCSPDEISAEEGTTFNVNVVFVGRDIKDAESVMDDFTFTCDESIAAMTGKTSFYNNTLVVEFEALKVGVTEIEICGAKCSVTVTEAVNGVQDILTPEASTLIRVDAAGIHAEGCRIALYNAAGILMGAGENFVATDRLARGIYVATATDNQGNAQTLKVVIR